MALSVLFAVLHIIPANMRAVQTFMYYTWKYNFDTTLPPKIGSHIPRRLDGSGRVNRALSKAQILNDLSENNETA